MKNRFFVLAQLAAGRFVGRPSRLAILATRFLLQLDRSTINKLSLPVMYDNLKMLGRMLSAYAGGAYRRVPAKAILTVTAALVYFLNPLDLVPDALPALGLTDDFAVLAWVHQSFSVEWAAFRQWEQSTVSV